MAGLAWLGRRGTGAVAGLLFVAMALPPLGVLLAPLMGPAVFVLLCIAFMRLDVGELRGIVRQPALVFAGTAWTLLAAPILFAASCRLTGVADRLPDLYLGLMLQGIASPMMSVPAFVALLGFDATLVLMVLVVSSALMPLTASLFAAALGLKLSLPPLELGLKLFAFLAGAALLAALVRRFKSRADIERRRAELDGVNIIVLFLVAAVVMRDMVLQFLATPWIMVGLIALAFATFALMHAMTMLVFLRAGHARAFSLAYAASHRNMVLLLAATGGGWPDLAWHYFAACQFPIYLSPRLLRPLIRRLKPDP